MNKIDGIIFDMDGVLVDVSGSYRLAIEKTANYFLKESKVTQKDISALKTVPGFNNDWDVSFALIDLFEKEIKKNELSKKAKPITKKTKESKRYKEIKDIFQVFYLGSQLYKTIEKKEPSFKSPGLINDEKCIISIDTLETLVDNFKLGIATSRPRAEALYAIQNFKLEKYFPKMYVIAQEDAEYEKPHPAPLIAAKKRMGVNNPWYIGDSVNDCLAAKAASMPVIFVGNQKYGDYQIAKTDNILEVISL